MAYEIVTLIIVPLARATAGWLINALEDNKIDFPEWKKLVKTILKLGIPSTALFYGFNFPVELAASIPIMVDFIFGKIKVMIEKAKEKKSTKK